MDIYKQTKTKNTNHTRMTHVVNIKKTIEQYIYTYTHTHTHKHTHTHTHTHIYIYIYIYIKINGGKQLGSKVTVGKW